MEKKKVVNFIFWIVAIILGVTLYKQFDFETFKFEKPALAVVYFLCFAFAVFILVKNSKKGAAK